MRQKAENYENYQEETMDLVRKEDRKSYAFLDNIKRKGMNAYNKASRDDELSEADSTAKKSDIASLGTVEKRGTFKRERTSSMNKLEEPLSASVNR